MWYTDQIRLLTSGLYWYWRIQALHHYSKRKNKPFVYCEQDILLGVVLIVFYVYKNVQQFKDFFVKYVCRCTETEMYRLLDIQLNLFLFFLTITLVLIMVFVKFFKILFFSYNKTWFFSEMPQLEGKIGYKRKNSLLFILIITKHSLLWWDTNTTALDKSNNKKYEWITNFKSQKRCWHNTQNWDSVTVDI